MHGDQFVNGGSASESQVMEPERRERLGNGGAEESPGKKKQKTNKQTNKQTNNLTN